MVLNLDNAEERRAVELCYRTRKTVVNPIIDWEEEDVWEFLNEIAKVPHCSLYDEGRKRIGCIGCPMGGIKGKLNDFKRWKQYKKLYMRAFDKMLQSGRDYKNWKTAEDVFNWWLKINK